MTESTCRVTRSEAQGCWQGAGSLAYRSTSQVELPACCLKKHAKLHRHQTTGQDQMQLLPTMTAVLTQPTPHHTTSHIQQHITQPAVGEYCMLLMHALFDTPWACLHGLCSPLSSPLCCIHLATGRGITTHGCTSSRWWMHHMGDGCGPTCLSAGRVSRVTCLLVR